MFLIRTKRIWFSWLLLMLESVLCGQANRAEAIQAAPVARAPVQNPIPAAMDNRETSVVVEPAVQVSRMNAKFIHDEVIIAADPSNPVHLLACSIVHGLGARTVTNVAYTTSDSGRTWTQAFLFTGGIESYDPTCAWGTDGRAYFAGIQTISTSPFKTKVLLYRSDDGGETWAEASEIGNAGPNDRPFVTVDDSPGKYRGAVYVVFTNRMTMAGKTGRAASVFRSINFGKSFEHLSSTFGSGDPSTPGGFVLPDGTYVSAVRHDSSNRTEILRRVTENRTLQPDGTVSLLQAGSSGSHLYKIADSYNCAFEQNGSTMASFAADAGSNEFHGRLYAVWPDSRSGRCEILISHSEDNGKTWSTPFAVNDDAPRLSGAGPNDARPAVAVNANGVVGVLWYDRRDSDDDRGWTARFAASTDGGETFLPSVPLSSGQTRFMYGQVVSLTSLTSGGGSQFSTGETMSALLGYDSSHGLDGGDTSGLVADATGKFHALWVDNSTGLFQIWTAAVRVNGVATRNGARQLDGLDDISKNTVVLFNNVDLDMQHRLIVADLSILNTSNLPLHGPLKLRILRALSPAGLLKIINADASDGYAAVVDLSSQVPAGVLEPHHESLPKHIEIGLPENADLNLIFAIEHLLRSGDGSYRTGFVRLDLKLLGQAAGSISDNGISNVKKRRSR